MSDSCRTTCGICGRVTDDAGGCICALTGEPMTACDLEIRALRSQLQARTRQVSSLREALMATDSLLSLVRHRHRRTPWPDDLTDDVDKVLTQASRALRDVGGR